MPKRWWRSFLIAGCVTLVLSALTGGASAGSASPYMSHFGAECRQGHSFACAMAGAFSARAGSDRRALRYYLIGADIQDAQGALCAMQAASFLADGRGGRRDLKAVYRLAARAAAFDRFSVVGGAAARLRDRIAASLSPDTTGS